MADPGDNSTLHVLAVCVGNVCRSPFIERLLAARSQSAGLDVTASSAGVGAVVGSGVHPAQAEELLARGVDPGGFAARQLTAEHLEAADLVLTATRDIRTAALQVNPRALRKTFTLLELAAIADAGVVPAGGPLADWVSQAAQARPRVSVPKYDIVDPIGRDRDVHTAVAARMQEAVDAVVTAWVNVP